MYVLFDAKRKIGTVICDFWRKFANFCKISFIKVF
jgi:hypothetical protein